MIWKRETVIATEMSVPTETFEPFSLRESSTVHSKNQHAFAEGVLQEHCRTQCHHTGASEANPDCWCLRMLQKEWPGLKWPILSPPKKGSG